MGWYEVLLRIKMLVEASVIFSRASNLSDRAMIHLFKGGPVYISHKFQLFLNPRLTCICDLGSDNV